MKKEKYFIYYADDNDLATTESFDSEEKALLHIKSNQGDYDSDVNFLIVKEIACCRVKLVFEPNLSIEKI